MTYLKIQIVLPNANKKGEAYYALLYHMNKLAPRRVYHK